MRLFCNFVNEIFELHQHRLHVVSHWRAYSQNKIRMSLFVCVGVLLCFVGFFAGEVQHLVIILPITGGNPIFLVTMPLIIYLLLSCCSSSSF